MLQGEAIMNIFKKTSGLMNKDCYDIFDMANSNIMLLLDF